MADMREVISTAIEFEHFGHKYYLRFHELVADEKAKALMKSLAEDEKEHAEILSRELAKLGAEPKKHSKEMLEKGLAEMFPEKLRKNSIATRDAISAIKLGMRTEERSIGFYSKNAGKGGEKLKKIFEQLEQMEKGHLNLLKENLHYLENDGSWFGYVPILEG
jgi:rubrerythrin